MVKGKKALVSFDCACAYKAKTIPSVSKPKQGLRKVKEKVKEKKKEKA